MNHDKFQEQVFFSTVRITVIEKSDVGQSIGTGFIYRASLNDMHGSEVLLLVSNRHVFGDDAQLISLNFHKRKSDSMNPELGKIVPVEAIQFQDAYFTHSDDSIDLACLNISFITEPQFGIFAQNLFSKMCADFHEKDLGAGTDVWFVGYPENRYDIIHNLPILRRGHIASIPQLDFNGLQQFVIDAHVYPGSSGSPVFALLKDGFKFIGVLTQAMIRDGRLQSLPTSMDLGVQQMIGLGIVIKSTVVHEFINYVTKQILQKRAK